MLRIAIPIRLFILIGLQLSPLFAQPKPPRTRFLADSAALDAIIITGSLKPESKHSSPIAIEVYTPTFLRKNPSTNLFEALQNIHGVRPQVNCNICNTGDIHINGLEGPYTMVLIDGMPLVSGLSSVYGLSGIPSAMIERLEIIKGPASALFGSEAVGGLIHVVTKKASSAPRYHFEHFSTSHGEINTDLGFKHTLTKRLSLLTGINHFYFQQRLDQNRDQFTDVALQHRLSIFQKWHYQRPFNRNFQWATRFYTEDRWGGDVLWTPQDRGKTSRYGESIYTQRYELYGQYQLPVTLPMNLSVSATSHHQNSVYGATPFLANQSIFFGQLTAHPTLKQADILIGISWRYTQYRDNTAVNKGSAINNGHLPGVFAQWEKLLPKDRKILMGMRVDHHPVHGPIFTPRIALKHKLLHNTVRWNLGSGFRVVNVFTEDHAALTGARTVVLNPNLQPEKSMNINVQLLRSATWKRQTRITREFSAFYTHFQNRILPNYNVNPNEIHYDNLQGYAYSRGISGKLDVQTHRITLSVGATWMNVSVVQHSIATRPLLTEKLNGTMSLSWKIPQSAWQMDYTSSVCSPMALPLLGPLDPRPPFSPWWALHNVQFTLGQKQDRQLFFGVKNMFNFTPARSTPFLIARSADPFDKGVTFDSQGNPIPSSDNPYALTFDPSYVYAPNQGRRFFLGFRMSLKQ